MHRRALLFVGRPRVLVIVLAETRASSKTFDNFVANVLDPLDADLCVCVGAPLTDDDAMWKRAMHRFVYPEPDDYESAFDYAYDTEQKEDPWDTEVVKNGNAISNATVDMFHHYDGCGMHTVTYDDADASTYCVNHVDWKDMTVQPNVTTRVKNTLPWRTFYHIRDQFLGGIKLSNHKGSGGILLFFRWFLAHMLQKHNLVKQYDRFIITRSDFLYTIPHPSMDALNSNFIWIPDGERYGGVTDRHVVLSREYVLPYLGILQSIFRKSYTYLMLMKNHHAWNLEQLIRLHLEVHDLWTKVRFMPYIMYSIRLPTGTTRWSTGTYYEHLGYYVKYPDEYDAAQRHARIIRDDPHHVVMEIQKQLTQ